MLGLNALAVSPANAFPFFATLMRAELFSVVAAAALLCGIIFAVFSLKKRNRRALIKSETTRIRLIARRNLCTAIIVAPCLEASPLSRGLEAWLTELGFAVTRIENLALLSTAIDFTPTITAIDCSLGGKIVSRIESHFQAKSLSQSATVIFYNASAKVRAERRHFLKNVHFLAGSFTRTEIVRIIAPLLTIETVSDPPAKMALEGEIGDQTASDMLEYIEAGGRTGVLTIRDSAYRILGVIGAENGVIIYARTSQHAGESAVMDLLSVTKGYFQFRVQPPGFQPHCSLSPTLMILQRAKKNDESRRGGLPGLPPMAFET